MVDWWYLAQEEKESINRFNLAIDRLINYKKENDVKEFTKSDLKDGMVVEYRNSLIEHCVQGGLLTSLHGNRDGYNDLYTFAEDLLNTKAKEFDIMKVSYMGEVLWEREEWVEVTPLGALRALAKKGAPLQCMGRDDRESWVRDILDGVHLVGDGWPFKGQTEEHEQCKIKESDLA